MILFLNYLFSLLFAWYFCHVLLMDVRTYFILHLLVNSHYKLHNANQFDMSYLLSR